jgi:hypothetical protein
MLALVALLAVTAAVWGPFGLRATGLIEEWTFYQAFDRGQSLVWPDVIAGSGQPNRPFVLLAYGLSYWLTPDSFVGLNVVSVLLFVGKGLLLYVVVRRLVPDLPGVAFFSAVLLVVHPADTGHFIPRLLSYHAAVFFYLLAVYCLLRYRERSGWVRLLAMWSALALSLGTYEVAHPLVLLSPLLLAWADGGFTRRVARVTALWYLVPLLHGLWTLAVVLQPTSYQRHVLGLRHAGAHAVGSYLYHFGRAYARVFVTGWQDAAQALVSSSWFATVGLAIGLGAAGIVGVLGWVQLREAGPVPDSRRLAGVLLAGIVIVGAGFVPFLPLPHHRALTDRVFLFSSIGGAVAASALLCLATRRVPGGKLAFAGAASALVGLASVGALHQQQQIRLASVAAQRILAGVATAMPAVTPGTVVLVLDPAGRFAGLFDVFALSGTSGHFADAVRFLYRDASLRTSLCYPGRPAWGMYAERCELTPSGVTLSSAGVGAATFPYERLVLLEQRESGDIVLVSRLPGDDAERFRARGFRPEKLVRPDAPPPPRVHTVLERWPFVVSAYPGPQRWVRVEFDRPVAGYGWHPPEGSVTWMSGPRSDVELWLRPDRSYRIALRLVAVEIVSGAVQSLTLAVNDRPVGLSARPDGPGGVVLEGRIPQPVVALDRSQTRLTFRIARAVSPQSLGASGDPRILGLLFDWLRIEAEPPGTAGRPAVDNRSMG